MYRTGDLARYHDDGRIECLGRVDDQVKVRGFRIELGEVESALKQHSAIRECVVVASENAAGDSPLVAYFTPTDAGLSPTTQALRAFLTQSLPDYMIPAAFVTLKIFPMTLNGKVDRKTLARGEYESAGQDLAQHVLRPRTAQEFYALQTFQRILGVQNIGLRDNFFDLGGNSLLAVRLISEVKKSLDVNLTVPDLFLNPTVEGIARAFQEGESGTPESKLIPMLQGRSAGTLFFIDASIRVCALAQNLDVGLSSFATTVPIKSSVLAAAVENREADLPTLEELAAPHAALIQRLQPSRPCVLVGHSFNGLLAFEVAHQLQRHGRVVDVIVLLDASAKRHWSHRLKFLTCARLTETLKWRLEELRLRTKRRLRHRYFNSCSNSDSTVWAAAFGELHSQLTNVPWEIQQKINFSAFRSYRYRKLESLGVLIRAIDAHRYVHFENMGWDDLFARGLEKIDTPGDHDSLLELPQVLGLSQALKKCLSRLVSQRESLL